MMQVPARIGGRQVGADEWIEVLSPYDQTPVARVPALTADHVAEAVAAAEAALARADFPQYRRAEVLERAAELLSDRIEAFALANDSDYGLQAGIFTADLGVALRAARELRFGGILINQVPSFRADQQPYGGLRDAGNTREGPAYTVHEMTELRVVLVTP